MPKQKQTASGAHSQRAALTVAASPMNMLSPLQKLRARGSLLLEQRLILVSVYLMRSEEISEIKAMNLEKISGLVRMHMSLPILGPNPKAAQLRAGS